MTRDRLLILVPLLALVAGCKAEKSSLYPLSEGHKWNYRVGSPSKSGTVAGAKVTLTNMPPVDIAGRRATQQKIETGGQISYVFLAEDVEGIFELAHQGPMDPAPTLSPFPVYYLGRPYVVGNVWQSWDNTRSEGPFVFVATIDSLSEAVTVPAGTFESCAGVTERRKVTTRRGDVQRNGATLMSEETAFVKISWYCPGVGLVKVVNWEVSVSGIKELWEMELVSHTSP